MPHNMNSSQQGEEIERSCLFKNGSHCSLNDREVEDRRLEGFNLLSLPFDVVCYAFQFLPPKDMFCTLRTNCQVEKLSIRALKFVKIFDLSDQKFKIAELKRICERCPNLRRIECLRQNTKSLKWFCKQYPALQSFQGLLTPNQFDQISNSLPSTLTSLKLGDDLWGADFHSISKFTKLTNLHLTTDQLISHQRIFKHCSKLDDLTIDGVLPEGDIQLAAQFLTLKTLRIRSYLEMSQGDWKALTNHFSQALTEINIVLTVGGQEEEMLSFDVSQLGNCVNLKRLEFECDHCGTGFTPSGFQKVFQNCTKLECITANNAPHLLDSISVVLPKLHVLKLFLCELTSPNIDRISQFFPNLCELAVYDFDHFSLFGDNLNKLCSSSIRYLKLLGRISFGCLACLMNDQNFKQLKEVCLNEEVAIIAKKGQQGDVDDRDVEMIDDNQLELLRSSRPSCAFLVQNLAFYGKHRCHANAFGY